ncbi:SAM-dependent methyltransferase [Vibrio astriarenae]|nr:SAM-dependent methyltransferase [Vibrio sp. C7]
MAVDWDAVAETWEHNEAVQTFADQVFASLSELTQVSNKTILDFGCGTGILSQQLAPMAKSIVALDSSEAMIEVLEEKNLSNVEPVVDMLTRGLVAQHPAFRGQFDLVVASSVCGFIPSFADACDIIYSILEDDGLFVHWDWEAADAEEGLTKDRVEQVLSCVGFKDVTVKEAFTIQTEQGPQKVIMGIAKK